MARYSTKKLRKSEPLSDGSVLEYVLPRDNHINQAIAVFMERAANRADSLKANLSEAQLVEYEAQKEAARAANAPEPTEKPDKDWVAQQWGIFEAVDHETLVAQCARGWTDDDGPVVDHDINGALDYGEVPAYLLKEAAEVIYTARVGKPKAVRGN